MSTSDSKRTIPLRHRWLRFKRAQPGMRFVATHERYALSAGKSRWRHVLYPLLAFLCMAGGVVLLFVPGPGLALIVLSGALVAMQSRPVAQRLDRAEVWGRARIRALRLAGKPVRPSRPARRG